MRQISISLLLLAAGAAAGFCLARHAPFQRPDVASRPLDGACSQYIDRALSGWFVDERGHQSLRLVPTACGRDIGPADTPYMFYEIVKTYGDPEQLGAAPSPGDRWKNVRGMINQLTCHLRIASNKPQWNLEPYRPWVGDEATEQAGCNPE
nr:DUF2599 domain-containing protein [Luteibacter yeojuensis]